MFIRILALVSLVALVGCRGWTSPEPPVHLNPNMDTQEKHKAYRASHMFDDGRSMRTPPAGTIPRTVAGNEARDALFLAEDNHLYTGVTDEGVIPDALPAALTPDADMLARGEERYNIYCAPCHAKHGRGNGTVASRLTIKPPDFHGDSVVKMPLSHYFRIITHGKPLPEDRGAPDDKLNMPSYAAQISVEDRWAISAYLRTLQLLRRDSLPKADDLRLASATPAPESEDAEGEEGDK